MRNLIIVPGDSLDAKSAAFDGFDKSKDAVWMAEVTEEATHVWSHKARIVMFLSAMRHFRDMLQKRGITVKYRQLDDRVNRGHFAGELKAAVQKWKPERLVMVQAGEWRVQHILQQVAEACDIELEVRPDRHFFSTPQEFAAHAVGRKQLRLEYFYRELRRKTGVLMDGDTPAGGKWNYDANNRGSFSKNGPGDLPRPKRFRCDAVTRQVMDLVERRFQSHPGRLDHFDWPVTAQQARLALSDFIEHRLQKFGQYQDAMWADEPYLYHSRISAALNLKLLDPRDVVAAAEVAYRAGQAPLNAAEGFIRQVLGWREFVRGIYWLHMPEYLERNTLQAREALPAFFWTGDTDMNCLRQTITQTLDHGYAHHIQRLMVTGLFCLLYGVDPKLVHEWYLAVYVDAVEWVELPNSLGMSQYADDGVMGSKPYCASGKYIQRMSNYCGGCRYDPAKATGEDACPLTTLYWNFLCRHEKRLKGINRMAMQLKNLKRKKTGERRQIRRQAAQFRATVS